MSSAVAATRERDGRESDGRNGDGDDVAAARARERDDDVHRQRKAAIVAAKVAKTVEASERKAAVRARAEALAQAKREELSRAVEAKARKIEEIAEGKGKDASGAVAVEAGVASSARKSVDGARKSADSERASLEGRPQWVSPVDGEETMSVVDADVGTPANGDASVKAEVEKIEERVIHNDGSNNKVNSVETRVESVEVELESDEDVASEHENESADESEAPFTTPVKSPQSVVKSSTPTSTPSKSASKTQSAMKTKLNELLSEAREIKAASAKELAASPLRSSFKQRFSAPKEPNALEKVQTSVRRSMRRVQSKVSAVTDKYPKQVASGVGALALMVLLSQRRGRDVPVAARKKR
jgi:hypothetical protein